MDKNTAAEWLSERAFPLWAGVGFDEDTDTVWEALDHDGRPIVDMPKRLRVQARQAYCFAVGAAQVPHLPALSNLAQRLFRFAVTKGVDPETGNLAGLLNPDGTICTAPHDLYDVAFMLLAASALISAGHDVASDLERIEAMLERLRAPRGWHECAAGSERRRQNPHMHMFECSTALYSATGEPRFREMAGVSLNLFRDVFLQPDGSVLEHFDRDWEPITEGQAVEPGHMVEWVYLLDAYETITGEDTGVDIMRIFESAWAMRDAAGALPDSGRPLGQTRRSWPQTELLKASIVLARRGCALPQGAEPGTVANMLWREYLDVPVQGGWYDKRNSDGALLSRNMPASTFYHVLVALNMYVSS